MNECNHIRAQIDFYLDGELSDAERAACEKHFQECTACSQIVTAERRFVETLRAAQPLYPPSPELRARVQQMLDDAPPTITAPPALRWRVSRFFWPGGPGMFSLFRDPRVAVFSAFVVLFALVGIWYVIGKFNGTTTLPPSDFARMAVDTHLRYLRGQLPLEISSTSPDQVSAWFTGKVPFSLKLPNYQEASGQEKLYNLEGARLVGFKNDYAAYVAYRMRQRPITLVVTSNTVAMPSGGEEIVSKGLTFHYDTINGLKVITWTDRGLTYALVSDLEERGQQSCLVCHAGTKDRDFIEGLKTSR